LQVLVDLGLVVGGLVLVVAFAGLLRAALRSFATLPSWGVGLAVVALLIQNLVDFSLWIPAVGLVAVTADA
ncbi:MAG TPA: hypothetical protein PK095_16115, partial [Myxococcota bacterium]|nr:hypothetical protein [Myxococcota bacterium]